MEIYRVKFNTNNIIDSLSVFKKILKKYKNDYKLYQINYKDDCIVFTRKYNYNIFTKIKKKVILDGKIIIYYKKIY